MSKGLIQVPFISGQGYGILSAGIEKSVNTFVVHIQSDSSYSFSSPHCVPIQITTTIMSNTSQNTILPASMARTLLISDVGTEGRSYVALCYHLPPPESTTTSHMSPTSTLTIVFDARLHQSDDPKYQDSQKACATVLEHLDSTLSLLQHMENTNFNKEKGHRSADSAKTHLHKRAMKTVRSLGIMLATKMRLAEEEHYPTILPLEPAEWSRLQTKEAINSSRMSRVAHHGASPTLYEARKSKELKCNKGKTMAKVWWEQQAL